METTHKEMESKMRVQALSVDSEENMVRCLSLLKSAMQEIQKKNSPVDGLDELYRSTFMLVLHGHGERLYGLTKEVISIHVESKVKDRVVKSKPNDLVKTLQEAWNEHQTAMAQMCNFLLYMDLHHVQQNGFENLRSFGIRIFREKVYDSIRDQLQTTLLKMAEKQRCGEGVPEDAEVVKTSCQILISLGIGTRVVYEEGFERSFLQKLVEFYKLQSQTLLKDENASIYVTEADILIRAEEERDYNYLDASTKSEIIKVAEEELLSRPLNCIVNMENSGVIYMLKNKLAEELDSMLKLFSRVPNGRETIENCIANYVRECREAEEALKKAEAAAKLKAALLEEEAKKAKLQAALIQEEANKANLKAALLKEEADAKNRATLLKNEQEKKANGFSAKKDDENKINGRPLKNGDTNSSINRNLTPQNKISKPTKSDNRLTEDISLLKASLQLDGLKIDKTSNIRPEVKSTGKNKKK